LQRFSRALPSDGEASQQQHAAIQAAATDSGATSWMLPATELVLQCIANLGAMHSLVEASAVAAGDNVIASYSGAPEGWAAAKELLCILEQQLECPSSTYASIYDLVQLVRTRLGGDALHCMA
jgi:hypothetical protein